MPEDRSVQIQTDPVSEVNCSKCGASINVSGIDSFVKVECPSCHNEETVPARLGPFLLLELIGSGGMGGVYRARDESLGRMVAIKVMLKSYGDNPDFIQKFKKEAQATAKLNHPNIVQIYSFGQEKGQPYIVMEFIGGQQFDKMVDAGKPINPALVLKVGIDVAQGLSAAEEAGLIHGDVKPENILLDDKTQAKIVDFGIASVANEQSSEGIWGTPYYIAPEKVRRQAVDSRADIYSLGATLYHALAGKPPFEGETPVEVVKARFDSEPENLEEIAPKVTSDVARIINRMLQVEPAMRYPTYASALSDMRKALHDMGGETKAKTGRKRVKTIVKKGTTRSNSGTVRAPAKAKETGKQPAQQTAESPTSDALAEYRQRSLGGESGGKKKRKSVGSKSFLCVLLVLFGIGVLGGGTLWWMHHRNKTIRQRKEFIALAEAKQSADSNYSRLAATVSNMNTFAEKARKQIATATNAASYVTGQPVAIPEFQPGEKTQPAGGTTEEPAEETTKPDDEKEPEEPEETDAKDKDPDKAEEESEEGQDSADLSEAAAPAADAPEVVKLAWEAADKGKDVLFLEHQAESMLEKSASYRQNAKAASISSKAKKNADLIAVNRQKAEKLLSSAESALDEMAEPLEKVLAIKEEEQETREARKRARLEEQRRKERLAEQRRKEQEYQARVDRELAMVREAMQSARRYLRTHEYAQAVKSLSRQKNRYSTEEAKEAVHVAVRRYELLRDMKKFFIKQLKKNPFPWGWIRKANGREDILGANSRGVKLRGRLVPWSRVSARQMLEFIRHFLEKEEMMTVKELGKYHLAAAVFSKEHGGEAAADRFMSKAISLYPPIEDEARLILSDKLKENQEEESQGDEDSNGGSGLQF